MLKQHRHQQLPKHCPYDNPIVRLEEPCVQCGADEVYVVVDLRYNEPIRPITPTWCDVCVQRDFEKMRGQVFSVQR
jgi:hypothetical protein